MQDEIFEFNTIAAAAEFRVRERASRFIARLFPVSTKEEFNEIMARSVQDHQKASHNCFAYRMLENGRPLEIMSDDGEPSGSAGLPILNVLKSHELLQTGCIVTRYYGGTKLGIPGLIQAYSAAAEGAADKAIIARSERKSLVRLAAPMRLQPFLLDAAKRTGVHTTNHSYDTHFNTDVIIPLKDADSRLMAMLKILSAKDLDNVRDYLDDLELEFIKVEEVIN